MEFKEMNRIIDRIVGLIRKGYSRGKILSEMIEDVEIFSRDKLFEIAKCRIKAKKKFGDLANRLFFDEDGLRYSTSPHVATYRAERLRGSAIADISCGVGIQALYFAMKSENVVSVERDQIRLELAKLNAESLDIENIEFIHGDARSTDIVNRIKADIVFSDPSRKPQEPVRTLETLEPSPIEIFQIYRKKTDKISFELPPQISREKITIEGEKEYTSLDFRLNRLALYTGDLAVFEVSAVSLPSGEQISNEGDRMDLRRLDLPLYYIYEVDPTIVKADLLENLAGKLGFDGFLINKGKRRTLLTSNHEYSSAFLRRYVVRSICEFSIDKIRSTLMKLGAGKVTLRTGIDPDTYWTTRRKIERGLSGDKHIHIFEISNRAVIVESV